MTDLTLSYMSMYCVTEKLTTLSARPPCWSDRLLATPRCNTGGSDTVESSGLLSEVVPKAHQIENRCCIVFNCLGNPMLLPCFLFISTFPTVKKTHICGTIELGKKIARFTFPQFKLSLRTNLSQNYRSKIHMPLWPLDDSMLGFHEQNNFITSTTGSTMLNYCSSVKILFIVWICVNLSVLYLFTYLSILSTANS